MNFFGTTAGATVECAGTVSTSAESVSASILYFEELFCHWERWLEWLASPQTATN